MTEVATRTPDTADAREAAQERAYRALRTLARAVDECLFDGDDADAAISTLCGHLAISRSMGPDLHEAELDEALVRARRDEIEDCIIHLGRALPREFAGIVDALERALGARR